MRILTIITLLFFGKTWGQNLVPNPSFEDLIQCPNNSGQIQYANGWSSPSTWGTPDLYSTCSSIVSIPSYCNCDFAYQFPNSGNSYVGIYTYGFSSPNGREYIQSQLNSTLLQNQCYKITYYVNLLNGSKYATNNLDVFFSQNQVSSSNSILNFTSSISNHLNVIEDTLTWIKVSGIYEALGNEQFILIGNFKNDFETEIIEVNSNTVSDASYYLIDDVSVISISDLGGLPAYAGADTSIIDGDSVFIGQEISNLNCTWSVLGGGVIATNTSGLYVQPTEATTYIVEQNLCGLITYDTITVTLHGVGVSSLEGGQRWVTVSPNPNQGSFEVNLNGLPPGQLHIQISDASGRIVFERNHFIESKINIETNLNKGVYFLKLETDKGIFEEKLVIH